MDDQQLERLMGDQLRETQDFDFREEDWGALAPRLKRRRYPFIFWLVLAGLLFVGLSLFGGYYYKQYQYAQTKFEKAQEALENIQNENALTQKRTTHEIIDTVYKTVVVEQKLYTQIDTKEQESALKTKTLFNEENANIEKVKTNSDFLQKQALLNFNEEGNQENYIYQVGAIESLLLDSLDYNVRRKLPVKLKKEEGKQIEESLKKSKPKFVGLKWGWANPQNHFTDNEDSTVYPIQPPIQVFNKRSFQIGIAGEINLFKGAYLSAGVNLEQLNYEFSRTDARWDAQYGNPTDTIYVQLFRIGLEQLALRYTLGLKYQFLQSKKIQPFIGLRAEGGTYLRQRLTYHFNNFGDTNDAISYLREDRPSFGLEYVSPVFGFDYQISDKWKFQVEAIYLNTIQPREDRLQKAYGINAGLFFQID